jgi:quercetin 2,3-dioxygenase
LKRLAGPIGGNGAARINQDAHVFVAELSKGATIPYDLAGERAAWVHAVSGEVTVNGTPLKSGDAAAVSGEKLVMTGTGTDPVSFCCSISAD